MLSFININGERIKGLPGPFMSRSESLTPSDAEGYKRWRCPACEGLHKSEWGAEQCCPPEVEEVFVDEFGTEFDTIEELLAAKGGDSNEPDLCQVCLNSAGDTYEAASCCMWKTHSPAQRWHMAAVVRKGASWAEAIASASTQ